MNNKIVIYLRFNRTFAPDDKRRNSLLQSPTWWRERFNLFVQTSYRSLKAQTDQDFEIWAVFNAGQAGKYSHIKDFMAEMRNLDAKIHIVQERNNPTCEHEPIEQACKLAYAKYDNVVLINLDSDDHYHKDLIKFYKAQALLPGMCIYGDAGYIYDLNTHRMANYEGNGTPPPFWGLVFSKEARTDVATAFAYMQRNRMNGHHFQKQQATITVKLPAGMYLYSVHGKNTTTGWKNYNTTKHLRGDITDVVQKAAIVRQFGYE